MGVIGFVVFLVLGMCSGDLLAMNTSPEMLLHNIDVVSENATGGQQKQLRYSGDKETIMDGNLYVALQQGNRTLSESQLASRSEDDSTDFGDSEPEHSVTSGPKFTATSVFNDSKDQLNTTNKILSESSRWKDTSDHGSVELEQEANYLSGDQVELFQKYGTYFKPVVSTISTPAVTLHELKSTVMSGGQNYSGGSISLSDSDGIAQILNTKDAYEIPQSSGLERVARSSTADTEILEGTEEVEIIGVPKRDLNKVFGRFKAPENLLVNYSGTSSAEEATTEKNVDLEFALIDNITEESVLTFRDAEGNLIPCHAKLSVPINDSYMINGSRYSSEYNVTFPPGFFWKDVNGTYFGCICSLLPCMRKCCSEEYMYPPKGDSCMPRTTGAQPFVPTFFDENTFEPVEADEGLVVLYGMPCKFTYRLDPQFEDEENYLLPNGSILLPNYNNTMVEANEYCMEIFEGREGIAVLKCFPDDISYDYEEDDLAALILYPTGMLISIPFLLVTFFVYGIISELRNLHGKSLMCHVSSLAIAYIFLSTVQLGHKQLNPTACATFAFIIFFAFLASFFWLNVMCFDIFWTFSGIRPLRGSPKERENKKFVIYSCYAWGAPFLMLAIGIVMDLAPGIPEVAIKPQFGLTKCWFSNDPALTAYFLGPVGTLLVCNMLFFIITSIRIFQLKKETAMLKGADSRKSDDKANTQRFKLYLKLFVVMGVTWVMEVVSYVVGGPTSMWYVPDLCNTLQGLLIFLLFVWKKNVRTLLARKFGKASEPISTTGSQRSHAPTSRTTSNTTIKDRCSTFVTDTNSIHLKPINMYPNARNY